MKTNDIKEQEALDNNQYLRDKAMEAHREFKQACLEEARDDDENKRIKRHGNR